MSRALELAAGRPWLMLPEALDTLLAIADRQGNPEALEARLGRELDNARTVTLRDGVAIVPVTGPIFRYANLFTRISGATSTQVLATDLQAALDDPKVRAIVLNIDSPGGEANGISELADMVYAARDRKRIVAYIGGAGASAAYWIASAASEVVINDTGIAGSIGAALEVRIRAEEEGGGKRYEIVSRNAPNKRPDLSTDAGRAKLAETIDAMGDVFAAKVGTYLGVKAEEVPAMGDHGGLKVGAAAVAAGLAHRLGSLESLITELASPAATQRKPSMTIVRTTAELQAAIAAGADPKTIQIAEPVLATVESIDMDAIKTEASTAGAKAERERINGINALAAKGFEKEIAAAIEQGTSVEATALTLFKAAQDRGISLAGIKGDATGTSGANPPDGAEAAAHRKSAVSAIVAGAARR